MARHSRRDAEIAERGKAWEQANRDAKDPNLSPIERKAARADANGHKAQLRAIFRGRA